MSSASITGAIAAMAEPPQIPVPAEMRLDNFQFIFRALPTKCPIPKQTGYELSIEKMKKFLLKKGNAFASLAYAKLI